MQTSSPSCNQGMLGTCFKRHSGYVSQGIVPKQPMRRGGSTRSRTQTLGCNLVNEAKQNCFLGHNYQSTNMEPSKLIKSSSAAQLRCLPAVRMVLEATVDANHKGIAEVLVSDVRNGRPILGQNTDKDYGLKHGSWSLEMSSCKPEARRTSRPD